MIFFLIFFFIYTYLITCSQSNKKRVTLSIIILLFYIAVIFLEQLYLETFFNRVFHQSDPSSYFETIRHMSFNQLVAFLRNDEYKSNEFYYLLNWIYINDFVDYSAASLMIKITNALIFLSAYMILSNKLKEFSKLEYLVLLHPFLLDMIVRNVRDAYIIFFICLFIAVILSQKTFFKKILYSLLPIVSILFIRSFFLLGMGLTLLFAKIQKTSLPFKLTFSVLLIFTFFILFNYNLFEIKTRSVSALFSVFTAHDGYDQERDNVYNEIISGDGSSLYFMKDYLKRILMGIPIFLLTPHPYNYFVKFVEESNNGMWNIYTTFDNVLITLGAILNYLIFIPLLIKYIVNIRQVHYAFNIVIGFLFIMYSVFHLGITDVRIKFTFLFFLFFGLLHCNCMINKKEEYVRYVFISFSLFILIIAGSST